MVIIPLQPIASQRLQIVLDGQNCTIWLYYRWGRMYLDLTVDADPVLAGALCLNKVAVNLNPSLVFKGTLYFLDMQGNEAPQYAGLGDRWQLLYFSDGETPESVYAASQEA